MPKSLPENITAFFSSMRLAVLLLIILAVVLVVGTFIPQAQDRQIYIQRYGEGTYSKLRPSGFHRPVPFMGVQGDGGHARPDLLAAAWQTPQGENQAHVQAGRRKRPGSPWGLKIHNDLPAPLHALKGRFQKRPVNEEWEMFVCCEGDNLGRGEYVDAPIF